MPIQRCKNTSGKLGYKFGQSGKCYTGYGALAKAKAQEAAILATGWTANAQSSGKPKRRAPNPLRMDPTRTATLRSAFEVELSKRFNRIKRAVRELIVDEDAFGLRDKSPIAVNALALEQIIANYNLNQPHQAVENTRWKFHAAPKQLAMFLQWVHGQVQTEIIGEEDDEGGASGKGLLKYIQKGYQQGAARAFDDQRVQARAQLHGGAEQLAFYQGTREEFLRSAFSQPESIEKVQLLASRTLTDLKNVTDVMATHMSRELVDGLTRGENPLTIARSMAKVVDGIGKNRAKLIARTECLPGDTIVDSAMVRAVFRRSYSGPMVEVVTRGSRKFSATPNHPMLTQDGWVSAGSLKKGDKLICNGWKQDSRSTGNDDVIGSPTTLREIYNSLSAVGVGERVRCRKPDFHGDGVNSDVNIFRPDRELSIGRFTPLNQPALKNVFTPSGKAASRFCPDCGGLLPINQRVCFRCGSEWNSQLQEAAFDDAPVYPEVCCNPANRLSSNVSLLDSAEVDVGSVLVANPTTLPRVDLCGRVRSANALLSQNFTDPLLVGADSDSHFPLGETAQVEVDDVLTVKIRPFSGHVYNLQTVDGYYTINSLYTGNTIRAHAEGQLDALEQMGVEKVGVMVEFSSTPDGRRCARCAALEGIVLKVKEAHGLIPVHPQCRCSYIPANVGEPTKDQVRGKQRIQQAIDRSIRAEIPKKLTTKRTLAQQKKLSKWAGADLQLSKKRPKSVLNTENVYNRTYQRDSRGRFGSGGGGGGGGMSNAKRKGKRWVMEDGFELPEHVPKNIPPAWKQVKVSTNKQDELLVTGLDSKGRTQRVYSDAHCIKVAKAKFARNNELRKKRKAIRKELNQDVKRPEVREEAACLRLIQETGIRPGSRRDTMAEKQAYGGVTLQGKHVVVKGEKVRLQFTGKKGVNLDIPVNDKTIAKDLMARKRTVGSRGDLFNTSQSKLSEYAHTKDGGGFKTKDFRTAKGTSTAIGLVSKAPVPQNPKEYKKAVRGVATKVSQVLGNTPTVALQSYIDPAVFSGWRTAS